MFQIGLRELSGSLSCITPSLLRGSIYTGAFGQLLICSDLVTWDSAIHHGKNGTIISILQTSKMRHRAGKVKSLGSHQK